MSCHHPFATNKKALENVYKKLFSESLGRELEVAGLGFFRV
jgi:hypothetical protein